MLHELYHASIAPDLPERRVLDLDPLERRGEDEEDFANDFASDVALDERAGELAERCVSEAISSARRTGDKRGSMPHLKSSVRTVAAAESVPADALANYLAFVLSLQDEPVDWWATASKLQRTNPDPWTVSRNIFFEFARFDVLDEGERELITRALSEVRSE